MLTQEQAYLGRRRRRHSPLGTPRHRLLVRRPKAYLDPHAVQTSATRRSDPFCMSRVDEPVCVGGRVEDGVQGGGEGVQGPRIEAKATGEVRRGGKRVVDPADMRRT